PGQASGSRHLTQRRRQWGRWQQRASPSASWAPSPAAAVRGSVSASWRMTSVRWRRAPSPTRWRRWLP
ncbi:hypothetical protein HaLaN_03131, partial [Haematococcus lacustris]